MIHKTFLSLGAGNCADRGAKCGAKRGAAVRGLAALALVFGLTLMGCPSDTDGDGGSSGSSGGGDSALNGTWVTGTGNNQTKMTLNDGNLECSQSSVALYKGTYTASGGKLTINATHVYGAMFASMGLESKWYSKDEFKSALVPSKMTEATFNERFSSLMTGTTVDYSVNGNTLTMTPSKGETTTYTRQDGGSTGDGGGSTGGGSTGGGSTGGGSSGGSGSVPATLASGATYQQAIDKLDEIIAYCDSTGNVYKTTAESLKTTVNAAQSSWSSSGPTMVSTINSLISYLN